jgi:membrane dipeptidase
LGAIQASEIAPVTLSKPAVSRLRIIYSKYGYHADTLMTNTDQTYFTTFLQTVHSYIRVADMHNDISEQITAYSTYHLADLHTFLHTDIPRLQSGGMDAQIFAIWVSPNSYTSGYYQHALEQYNRLASEFAASPEAIQHVRTYSALDSAINTDKIAGIFFVEGGHHIENSLANLISLYNLGIRGMTITWNNSTDWAVSCRDAESATRGLSDFGIQVINAMDSLGMIIDVSHVGIQTISDILATTKNPIIASHSNARKLCNNSRNLYDNQIQAIAAGGGVIGVCFYPYFLTNSRDAALSDVIGQINYIVDLVGVEHVGLGSDFDGIEVWPSDLTDVTAFPKITTALLNEGYTESEIEKIMGGNFLRVFRQVCGDSLNL